jgi:hypothetical protein
MSHELPRKCGGLISKIPWAHYIREVQCTRRKAFLSSSTKHGEHMMNLPWAHCFLVSSSGNCGKLRSKSYEPSRKLWWALQKVPWAHWEIDMTSYVKPHGLSRKWWAHQESMMSSPGKCCGLTGKTMWAHHFAWWTHQESMVCSLISAHWAHLETVVSSLTKYHETTIKRRAHQESGMCSRTKWYALTRVWLQNTVSPQAPPPPRNIVSSLAKCRELVYTCADCSHRYFCELTIITFFSPWTRTSFRSEFTVSPRKAKF